MNCVRGDIHARIVGETGIVKIGMLFDNLPLWLQDSYGK